MATGRVREMEGGIGADMRPLLTEGIYINTAPNEVQCKIYSGLYNWLCTA